MTKERLQRIARDGRLIPVVGAGVSLSVKSSSSGAKMFPTWKDTLLQAAEILDTNGSTFPAMAVRGLVGIGECEHFLRAAQIAQDHMSSEWYSFLDKTFKRSKTEIDEESLTSAKAVWKIGAKLIITTNYDNVLEWACPSGDVDSIGNRQAVELSQILTSDLNTSAVWHLHGMISNKADIILGEKSYQQLYGPGIDAADSQHVALHTFRAILSSYTLLFVGFSMHDDYIRTQLEDIYGLFKGANTHYIILHRSEKDVFESRKLPIQPIYVSDFEEDLHSVLSTLSRRDKASLSATIHKSIYIDDKLINEITNDLKNKSRTNSTIRANLLDIKKFSEHFPGDISNLKRTDITDWLTACESQGLRSGTIRRRLASIKVLYSYLMKQGLIQKDPTYNLRLPNKPPTETTYVRLEDLNKAINAMPSNSPREKRDLALFKSIYYCALWSEEVTGAQVEDVDLINKQLHVRRANGEERCIEIHDDAFSSLSLWIESHPTGKGSLFCSITKDAPPLGAEHIRNIIQTSFERVGLKDNKYNPRALRHSLGAHMAQSNVNPLIVSRMLGHKNVYSSSRYFEN